MEVLKQTSIRLPESYIQEADFISNGHYQCGRSNVLRAALWVGLKIVSSKNLAEIMQYMWLDENAERMSLTGKITLEDVLRAAGVYPE